MELWSLKCLFPFPVDKKLPDPRAIEQVPIPYVLETSSFPESKRIEVWLRCRAY